MSTKQLPKKHTRGRSHRIGTDLRGQHLSLFTLGCAKKIFIEICPEASKLYTDDEGKIWSKPSLATNMTATITTTITTLQALSH